MAVRAHVNASGDLQSTTFSMLYLDKLHEALNEEIKAQSGKGFKKEVCVWGQNRNWRQHLGYSVHTPQISVNDPRVLTAAMRQHGLVDTKSTHRSKPTPTRMLRLRQSELLFTLTHTHMRTLA